VISTFGAMFAPDHAGAAAELVRVCRPGGRVLMTTWVNDGFVDEMFAAAGVSPEISRELVVFPFDAVEDAVSEYAEHFGLFVMARSMLEPQGRWDEFITAFRDLVTRFNPAQDGGAEIESEYYLITADR
jgi:SAM-dependent methyltransferase